MTQMAPTSFKMKTHFPNPLTLQLTPLFSPPIFVFHFSSLSRKNPNFHHFPHTPKPKPLTLCSSTTSESSSYGGWDDLKLTSDSLHSGESNQLHTLFNSLGIDDKKYIFVYLLGFICALAISRVKVSSFLVFPACLVVFAFGFSIGFINGGPTNDLSLTRRNSKDENLRVSLDKLRNLMDFFDGFDVKVVDLKNDIRRGIECNRIKVAELEGYIKVMESLGLSALNAKNIVEGIVDNISVESQEVERSSNQKSIKRKKEIDRTGFDFSQFVSGLFGENMVASKPNKSKDLVKRELADVEVNDHSKQNILATEVEKGNSSPVTMFDGDVGNGNTSYSGDTFNNPAMIQYRAEELISRSIRTKEVTENEKINLTGNDSGAKLVFESNEYSFQNKELRFMDNGQIYLNRDLYNSVETRPSQDRLLDLDFSVNLKHMRSEAAFGQEQKFNNLNGHNKQNTENETYKSAHAGDFDSSPSPMVSDDMVFNKYLTEANILLKQAREYLRQRGDDGDAENQLYKSAKLLSKAIEMKPMSLLAVGQLGNTYLLHGELKLKISRKLRGVLARDDPLSVERAEVLEEPGDEVGRKEKVASILISVCEECEELLVKAGRQYKLALSIDGNDMRALYNWGLALSFRAQLIADIGPEAAFDADKVFLAAIDKFEAMMSKSNVYAPDALFRWGMALQQRSRLRTRNSKDKVKLLQQSKRLYEDALRMDNDNLQIREALSSCVSELKYRNYY